MVAAAAPPSRAALRRVVSALLCALVLLSALLPGGADAHVDVSDHRPAVVMAMDGPNGEGLEGGEAIPGHAACHSHCRLAATPQPAALGLPAVTVTGIIIPVPAAQALRAGPSEPLPEPPRT